MSLEKELAIAIWEHIEPRIKKELAAMEARIMERLSDAMPKTDSVLTVKETSKIIGVNPNAVRALAESGALSMIKPPGQTSKILRSSVDDYFRRMKDTAQAG